MRLQVFLDILRLCYDIARDEAVGNLETLCQRVVEHPAAQFLQQLCLRLVGERFHIFHVCLAVLVERGRQCLVHIVGVGNLVHVVRHGMVEDVGLDRLAVGITLQGKDFPVIGIHAEQVDVLLVVQVAELTDKAVVQPVQADDAPLRRCTGGGRCREVRYKMRHAAAGGQAVPADGTRGCPYPCRRGSRFARPHSPVSRSGNVPAFHR